jgi:hypothetical protein
LVAFRRPKYSFLRWLTEDISLDEDINNRSLPALDVKDHLTSAEDIRLISDGNYNQTIFLIYTHLESIIAAVCTGHMRLAELSADPQGCLVLDTPSRLQTPPLDVEGERPTIQKNWSPFFFNHSLHFIFRFDPFTVLRLGGRVEGEQERRLEPVSEVATEAAAPGCRRGYGEHWTLNYGPLRGGTPAVLIDGRFYLTFFHSKLYVVPGVSPRMTYFMGAATFSPRPPFTLRRISRCPIALDQFYTDRWTMSRYYDYVVFPLGFFLSEPTEDAPVNCSRCASFSRERGTGSSSYASTPHTVITLSLGRNDYEGHVVKLSLQDLLRSLGPFARGSCDPLFLNSTALVGAVT